MDMSFSLLFHFFLPVLSLEISVCSVLKEVLFCFSGVIMSIRLFFTNLELVDTPGCMKSSNFGHVIQPSQEANPISLKQSRLVK